METGFTPSTGIIFDSRSTCPYGICSTRPTSRTAAFDSSAPKVMIWATLSRPYFSCT